MPGKACVVAVPVACITMAGNGVSSIRLEFRPRFANALSKLVAQSNDDRAHALAAFAFAGATFWTGCSSLARGTCGKFFILMRRITTRFVRA